MRVFALTVAYDGSGFHGWQTQPGLRTVQGELVTALTQVLGARPASLTGAGRTDAGVHARGQVASFESDTALPERALAPLLGRALPRDIRVRAAHEMPADFHARHRAVERRYHYRLLAEPDLLCERQAWWPGRSWNPAALEEAVTPLPGEHDMTSFRSAGSSPAEPLCRITHVAVKPWPPGIEIQVAADHFLYHMVRNLVGTLLVAARAVDPAAAMRAVIAARDRAAAGPTAPAAGLCLEWVRYPEPFATRLAS